MAANIKLSTIADIMRSFEHTDIDPREAARISSVSAKRMHELIAAKKPQQHSWQQHMRMQPLNEPHVVYSKASAYRQGFNTMVKSAWIFSGPLGTQDVLQAPNVPKYLWDAAHGGSRDDPKRSPLRSLGMAGLAAGGTLFGLGFAGMGMRDLGLKMSLIAKRAMRNKALTAAEADLAHRMDVPAYTRFGKSMGALSDKPWLSKSLGALGTAAGGLAHPFNKTEDYLSRKLVDLFGNENSEALAKKLHLASQGRVFDNPAVRAASSMAALPILIGGDMMFAPYEPSDKKADYQRGFMTKLAQFRSSSEILADSMGGGTGAQIGGMVPYFIPGVGTAASLYDAGAQVGNAFSGGKTVGERLGHGAQALGNVGFAALNLIPGAGLLTGALKGVGKGAAGAAGKLGMQGTRSAIQRLTEAAVKPMAKLDELTTVSKNTLRGVPGGRYLTGATDWQQAMKNFGKSVPGWRGTAMGLGGRLAASPFTHTLGLGLGGAALSGKPMEQAVPEFGAKAWGAYGDPLTNWQHGAADYYRSLR